MEDVASSKIITGVSATAARAIEISCRCPCERFAPLPVSVVLYPCGSRMGNYNVMDDANIPNLIAMPYYEYPYIDKEIYANTREFMLSEKNSYYFVGKRLKGLGSPHTKEQYVWPLALIIQALTSDDEKEINACVKMLVNNTGNTGYMHESIHKDNDALYSRAWFAWANSLFSIKKGTLSTE